MDRTRTGAPRGSPPAWGVMRYKPVEWLLVGGNRLVVSGVLLLTVAVVVWGLVWTGLAPLEERTPMLYLLFALISGNFALITIVVSISQFVLARHLESPDEIRQRMNEMAVYRREVGESTRQSVLPITPAAFLRVLFHSIDRQSRQLARQCDAVTDERLQARLDGVATGLETHTEYVIDILEGADRSLETALIATLNANYGRYIYEANHLQSHRGEELPDDTVDLLDEIVKSLEQVDVARRFLKTTFIQSELSSLTRILLFIGIPVQIGTVAIMMLFTATTGVGVSTGVLSVAVPLVVTVGFAPIVLLAAFILRLSTIVKRTAAMYPFTTDAAEVVSTWDERQWHSDREPEPESAPGPGPEPDRDPAEGSSADPAAASDAPGSAPGREP